MYRHQVHNFNGIVLVNTMWDLERLLRDRIETTYGQQNWSDLSSPLHLLGTTVAADVLTHLADHTAAACEDFDPDRKVKLKGKTLRKARQSLLKRYLADTLDQLPELVSAVAEQRCAVLLDPNHFRPGIENSLDQVLNMALVEGGCLARELVEDVYTALQAGTPCTPPSAARSEEVDDRIAVLVEALSPVLNAPRPFVGEEPTPAEIYADTVYDMTVEHLAYALNAAWGGSTVWKCDHVAVPSRLAGEILADLGMSPVIGISYDCFRATTPAALVLREIDLVIQVLAEHISVGNLCFATGDEYQSRWLELHPGDAVPEVTPDMHSEACEAVALPLLLAARQEVQTLMRQSDGWVVAKSPKMDGVRYKRPKVAPRFIGMQEDGSGQAASTVYCNTIEETAPATQDVPVDVSDDVWVDEVAPVDNTTQAADGSEKPLHHVVLSHLLADFCRLAEDHICALIEAPHQITRSKGNRKIRLGMAVDILETFQAEVADDWATLAGSGIDDPGSSDPDKLRAFYHLNLAGKLTERFQEITEDVAAQQRRDFLDDPTTDPRTLFGDGLESAEDGASLAGKELTAIFTKLTRGEPWLGRDEGDFGLPLECRQALSEATRDIQVILDLAIKGTQKLPPKPKSLLDVCARVIVKNHVEAILSAAGAPDSSSHLAGLMLAPLGVVSDFRAQDEAEQALSAPALLLREVEVAIGTLAWSLYDGELRDRVMDSYVQSMRKAQEPGQPEDIPLPDEEAYTKAIIPSSRSLDVVRNVLVKGIGQWDNRADPSPLAISVPVSGLSLQ